MPERFPGRLSPLLGLLVLVAGFALALWLYWPGIHGPALLDDHSSVLVIDDLKNNPELLTDYIFGDGSGPLGRPLSLATFVLEKWLIGDSVAISKALNIGLHLFNGLLVVLLLWRLLRFAQLPAAGGLAVALGLCWLLAPLHVSTVLYVVQRMAMLSTTFMLLACITYVLWRERLARGVFSALCLAGCGLFVVAGLFAKENAVVVIPVILLLEALWFQFRDVGGRVIPRLRRLTLWSIGLGAGGLAAVLLLRYEALAGAFRFRPFSLEERLLTQARALWDYLGQLVAPDLMRLGIYHDDFPISTGLQNPPSTLYALLAWGAVLVAGVVLLRWRSGRWLALGVAWYLVGHAVESSVLPLELYFEHRNYFPVVGLYLAVAAMLGCWFRAMPQVAAPVLVYVLAYAFWLALQTSSQVQVWSQRELLTFNHLNGHPESPRANTDMAVLMANVGDYERARHYSGQAFAHSRQERLTDSAIRDLALACLARAPVADADIARLGTANPQRPISSVTTLLTFVRLLQDEVCPDFDRLAFADRMAELFLVENFRRKAAANVYSSLATLENALGRFDYAYRYMQQFLAMAPDSTRGQLMQLHFTTALGKVEEAAALKRRLLDKRARGELTVGEQQNLALYLE